MKAPVDRATTARVLRDIDVVLRERTAAAVDRVLATASADIWGEPAHAALKLTGLYEELGVKRLTHSELGCSHDCDCGTAAVVDDATPGLVAAIGSTVVPADQRRRYAPEAVSPHLFGGAL